MDTEKKKKIPGLKCYPTPLPQYESDYLKRKLNLYPTEGSRNYAPFIEMIQKSNGPVRVHKRKRVRGNRKTVLTKIDLTKLLFENNNVETPLLETCAILRDVTFSKGATIYLVDDSIDEINQLTENYTSDDRRISYKIETGTNVAAHVASTKEFVKIDDLLEDVRFPEGLGIADVTVKAVLGVPVMTPEDDCLAVFVLHRDIEETAYDDNDLRLLIIMTGWIGSTIYQNQQQLTHQKQQELTDYLLNLTICFFNDSMELDKLITEVVNFAKLALNAEHGEFYVFKSKGDQELYADCYEEGVEDCEDILYKKKLEKKLNENDIVTCVARNGAVVNIRNAYNDSRVVKKKKRGYIIRSVLSIPIQGVDETLGVIQLMNKSKGSCFTKSDEVLSRIFSVYCGFVLSYARLTQRNAYTEWVNNDYAAMLTKYMQPCVHDYYFVYNHPEVSALPYRFNQFDYYISDTFEYYMPQLVMYMFNEISKDMFENLSTMCKFVLTVEKSYHNHPYHNFHHAFNVVHSVFNMLKRNLDHFTSIELKAIVIAAYCHDIDHYGVTNNFLEITNHFLAQLYDESILEQHHFHVTCFIIKFMNLFTNMPAQDYKLLIAEIKQCIIATDLAVCFKRRGRLYQICSENNFSWTDDIHRSLLKSIMMTMADLSGLCKPFQSAKIVTDLVYKEFYNEGDKEKEMGSCPLSIMDREMKNMIPADQVQFLTVVVLPCALILAKILPNCAILYKEGLKLRDIWQEINDTQGQRVWSIEDSFFYKKDSRESQSSAQK